MMPTLRDVTNFCYANQKRREKNGEFCGRSFYEWGHIVVDAANANKLHILVGENGITGVCIATERPATKAIFVHEIICSNYAFRQFIQEAFKRFPNYKITGLRNKQTKTYNKHNLWAADLHQ